MSRVIDRFMRYISIDTQSDGESGKSPSTAKQFDLARVLASELKEMGASDVRLDEEHCYVYAEIPANDESAKALGFSPTWIRRSPLREMRAMQG
jgi:tripeptide aminopeptidase